MENNQKDILNQIILVKETLPKKQKQLCDFIVENYKSIGMYTVAELASAAAVGTTTVLRVMKVLGYESFHDMRKEFHEVTINGSLPTWWHMKTSFETNDGDNESTILQTWPEIIRLLNSTLNTSLITAFNEVIDLMLNAKKINILGLRASKGAALYFDNLLEEFYPKTKQLSNDSEFIFDRILQFKEGDILFLITHSPYSTQSIAAAKFCHERNYPVVLITDLLSCPIAPYASTILKIEGSSKQYSITPTIALLETIVIEIGRRTSETSIKKLEELGNILKQKNITQ
ncbi:MurR/RpiR family transcriptional regulator [Bacillaceae bacterium IKA-2]|nr:MurR/RpiR family transcriptional regulator [Bacillaceae bacterium IKA-2]